MLSNKEINVLIYGMEKEFALDVRMHERMPQETFNLFVRYTRILSNPDLFLPLELEAVEAALRNCVKFWIGYLSENK